MAYEYLKGMFAAGTISTWFAGIGAFAAAGVALRLGLRQGGKEKIEADARAVLYAARISERLRTDAAGLRRAVSLMGFPDGDVERTRDDRIGDIADAVNQVKWVPDDATLLGLMPLENECAQRISQAYGAVDYVIDEISRGSWRKIPEDSIHQWERMLAKAADNLMIAVEECERKAQLPWRE